MTGPGGVEAALERRRQVVDEALAETMPVTDPDRLYGAARHLLDAGGKRLRSAILLLSAETLAEISTGARTDYRRVPDSDGNPVDVLAGAVSIELVQTFTLIHDDLIDDDELRRGQPAVHEAYDDSTAVLAGDTLYAKAFEMLPQTGASPERSLRALVSLAETCSEVCEGQSVDVAFESREAVTVAEYLEMIEAKTGVLFATAASLPAVLLGHEEAVEPLAAYGRDIGRAFQIYDDLLDLTTPTETLGKQRGSDLLEGKRTLLTVHAREQGVDVAALLTEETPGTVTDAEIDAVVERLEETGSLAFARQQACESVERGKTHLDALPAGDPRDTLAATADYLVGREY